MGRPGSGSSVPVELMVQPPEQAVLDREQAEALHEEIGRLPGSFRLPVVRCHFEGLTLDEAARRLRLPAGTVHSRLVPQHGNGVSRSREFAYTSQTLDCEAKEVTNARDSGKGQG